MLALTKVSAVPFPSYCRSNFVTNNQRTPWTVGDTYNTKLLSNALFACLFGRPFDGRPGHLVPSQQVLQVLPFEKSNFTKPPSLDMFVNVETIPPSKDHYTEPLALTIRCSGDLASAFLRNAKHVFISISFSWCTFRDPNEPCAHTFYDTMSFVALCSCFYFWHFSFTACLPSLPASEVHAYPITNKLVSHSCVSHRFTSTQQFLFHPHHLA